MIFALRYARNSPEYLIYIIMTFIVICISLVLHEVAHGLVAKWNGDYTAKYAGRLTLNPLKHFDPIGFIMMMLIGFGYAKPVPVNPAYFRNYRKGLLTVAVAGVVVNLLLAFFSALFLCVMAFAYNRAILSGASEALLNFCDYIYNFFGIMTRVNLALLFFNILPIYPLDGFRVVETFARRGNKYCMFMRVNGQYVLYGLVALSFIVSSAMSRVELPTWFSYLDVLGTYIDFFVTELSSGFIAFWALMIPAY